MKSGNDLEISETEPPCRNREQIIYINNLLFKTSKCKVRRFSIHVTVNVLHLVFGGGGWGNWIIHRNFERKEKTWISAFLSYFLEKKLPLSRPCYENVWDVCISHQSDWIYYKQPNKFLVFVAGRYLTIRLRARVFYER